MNNMNTDIKHAGVVDEIGEKCVKVRIVQSSACSSCKVAGHCNASEKKEKIVEVYGQTDGYSIGDSVIVIASQHVGYLAVLLSSVIPLFLLIVVLVVVLFSTGSEVLAALFSVISLIPYYLILYVYRNKIRTRLSFRIEFDRDSESKFIE